METFRRLTVLLRPHLGRYLGAWFCAAITCGGVLILPLAVKALLAEVIAHGDIEASPQTWVLIGIGVLLLVVSSYTAWLLFFDVTQRVTTTLRAQYLEHLLGVPLPIHRQQRGGDLLDRLTVSIADIALFLRYSPMNLATGIAILIGGPVILFYLHWKLSMVLVILVAACASVLALVSRRLRHSERASAAASGALTAHLQELLLGMDLVQAFNAQRHERNRFARQEDHLHIIQRRAARFAASLEPLVITVVSFTFLLLLGFGGRWIALGELTLDTLVMFLAYVAIAASQIRPLSRQYLRWQQLGTALHRLDDTLALPRETDSPGAKPLPTPVRGEIQFDGVSYTYPNRESALDRVSLTINPGECVGIVGESGAGKTTIFHLLLRFDQPQRGVIRVDGLDIQHTTAASLRAASAVVPQDGFLFNLSILENVRYGRPAATDAEVRAACRAAQADAFIATLAQGYGTIVGERGLQLSAGQRQRLAIARALLKDAPILLLDEATSALDAATERELRETMDTAMQGRTTLIIAHRLATVIHLPRLLVLHRGRLIADGSHEELLAGCPQYKALVSTQLVPLPEAVSNFPSDARAAIASS